MKADREAANAAASGEAQAQIKATADANAAASGERNAAEAAAKAAAAKPGFQRTAADKLAIQKAQEMGIKVEGEDLDQEMIEESVQKFMLFKPQVVRKTVTESKQSRKQAFTLFKV